MGIAQAATVRVGRAYGAGSEQGIKMSGWVAIRTGQLPFMAMTATLMLTMPHLLISAFLDLDDAVNAEVVGLAVLFLAIAALFQIVDGAQAVAGGMLRGLQDTKVPMFYAAIGYWGIGMPSGILLAFWFGLGGAGIWLGLCIGLAVVALMLVVRWLRRDRLYEGANAAHPPFFEHVLDKCRLTARRRISGARMLPSRTKTDREAIRSAQALCLGRAFARLFAARVMRSMAPG